MALVLFACTGQVGGSDGGTALDAATGQDVGAVLDVDAGSLVDDAGQIDTGEPDSGTPDVGQADVGGWE